MSNSHTSREFIERLYLAHYEPMLKYALVRLSDRGDAEDAVQDVFVLAQLKIEAMEKSDAPEGWLFVTLKNVIGDTYRRRAQAEKLCVRLFERPEVKLPPEGIFKKLLSKEDFSLLCRIYCDDISYKEAAVHLGISVPACRMRVYRARKKLTRAFERNFSL